MVDNGLVVLQNCKDLVKSEYDSCSDGFELSYDNGGDDDGGDEKKIMDIKVEAETDVEMQQEALDMIFPAVNFKHEVSFLCIHYRTVFMKMLDSTDLRLFPSLSASLST
jgi:hypothetical protein